MRRLAELYCNFLKEEFTAALDALNLFSRANFESLLNAIETYATSDVGDMKAGLKQNFFTC